MPTSPTYPGVYIEEIPSGAHHHRRRDLRCRVHRAGAQGAVNEPITINSFGDFERIFGGLWVSSSLGFAVRDFYLNGGDRRSSSASTMLKAARAPNRRKQTHGG